MNTKGEAVRFLGFVLTMATSSHNLTTIIILQYKVRAKHRFSADRISFFERVPVYGEFKVRKLRIEERVGNASKSDGKSFFERAYHNDSQAYRLQISTERKGARGVKQDLAGAIRRKRPRNVRKCKKTLGTPGMRLCARNSAGNGRKASEKTELQATAEVAF